LAVAAFALGCATATSAQKNGTVVVPTALAPTTFLPLGNEQLFAINAMSHQVWLVGKDTIAPYGSQVSSNAGAFWGAVGLWKDSVWAWTDSARTLVVATKTETAIMGSTPRVALRQAETMLVPIVFGHDGAIVEERATSSTGMRGLGETGRAVIRVSKRGEVVDTLALVRYDHALMSFSLGPSSAKRVASQPWASPGIVASAPSGSYIVVVDHRDQGDAVDHNCSIVLQLFDSTGARHASKVYPYQPVPLTDPIVNAYIAKHTRTVVGGERITAERLTRAYREALYRPAFLPHIDRALVAINGEVWLHRSDAGAENIWLIFDYNLELTQEVRLQSEANLVAVTPTGYWVARRQTSGKQEWLALELIRGRPSSIRAR
jgi:hypothetical protein